MFIIVLVMRDGERKKLSEGEGWGSDLLRNWFKKLRLDSNLWCLEDGTPLCYSLMSRIPTKVVERKGPSTREKDV